MIKGTSKIQSHYDHEFFLSGFLIEQWDQAVWPGAILEIPIFPSCSAVGNALPTLIGRARALWKFAQKYCRPENPVFGCSLTWWIVYHWICWFFCRWSLLCNWLSLFLSFKSRVADWVTGIIIRVKWIDLESRDFKSIDTGFTHQSHSQSVTNPQWMCGNFRIRKIRNHNIIVHNLKHNHRSDNVLQGIPSYITVVAVLPVVQPHQARSVTARTKSVVLGPNLEFFLKKVRFLTSKTERKISTFSEKWRNISKTRIWTNVSFAKRR